MNLSHSLNHTRSRAWRRLSWRLTPGLAALAIAAAAAIVVSPREGDHSQGSLERPIAPSIRVPRYAVVQTVYVVKTEEQAETILQEQVTLLQLGLLDLSALPEVVVDGTPAMDALMEMSQLRAELAIRGGEGSGLQVVDLRLR